MVSVLAVAGLFFNPESAFAKSPLPNDLIELNLEELMDIEITSVSKKPQSISKTAAAVSVITSEDIRRSGVTTIPDALRLVPGVHVARINSNQWAVSIRGFNGRFSNKLLVLIDGRSIYTPMFSGTYWDQHNMPMDNISRIEVIRGPGTSIWGANATNGIINIITKHASETQGAMLTVGVGNEERINTSIRQGITTDEGTELRSYVNYFNRGEAPLGKEDPARDGADGWQQLRTGIRSDSNISKTSKLTVQGDAYFERLGDTMLRPTLSTPYTNITEDKFNVWGANFLTNWSYEVSPGSDFNAQFYFEHSDRRDPRIKEVRDTLDIDLQYNFPVAGNQEIILGSGYRYSGDRIDESFEMTTNNTSSQLHLLSGFVQDEIKFLDDALSLVLGSKFEYNSFTGIEFQPSIRTVWTPTESQTIWGAVSRAVRTPAIYEDRMTVIQKVLAPGATGNPSALPLAIKAYGNPEIESEDVYALEVGYRFRSPDHFSIDTSAFYNFYRNFIGAEQGSSAVNTSPVTHVELPLTWENNLYGESYGIEIAAEWRPSRIWRIKGSYSYVDVHLHEKSGHDVFVTETRNEESTPHHQAVLISQHDFENGWEFDITTRYVDSFSAGDVSGYAELDLRLGWKPADNITVSLSGQNLLDSQHLEFEPQLLLARGTDVQRTIYAQLDIRF